jgi:hypothetical protein
MANRVVGLILVAGVGLAFSPAVFAQGGQSQAAAEARPAPRLPNGKPDLSGVWTRARESTGRHFSGVDGGRRQGRVEVEETTAEALMRPEARLQYRDQLEAGKARTIRRDLFDPYIKACAPLGFPRLIQQGRPFEILNLPNRLFFRYEVDHFPRDIWMDGRSHPDLLITPSTWMGHSLGHWDGDTLVVDTVGFNDRTWLDSPGHPHSESLRTTERYTRVSQDRLEIQVTFDDPEIYSEPLVGNTFIYRLVPDGQIMEWVQCDDRIRELLKMDICEIKEAWEFEAYCIRRESGLSTDFGEDAPRPGY